ncbi:hypothetical protein ACFXAF_10875 [Kitasatospora sp. NPDC059463]|uniref:hypothetical protein n=1 Tax=unclassified Kitasatospora TaxID=2633591 RepID=UPI00367578AB
MVLTSKRAFSQLARNNAYRAAYYRSVNPSTTPTRTLTLSEVTAVPNDYGLPSVTPYKA